MRPGVVRSGIVRGAGALLVACVLLAGELHAQAEGPPQARIYGVEVEASVARDRLLVFADGPVRPKLEEVDRGTVMLVFPGASLDPSAPSRVATDPDGALKSVTVFETAGEAPEVRITILRTAGTSPRLSRRGSQVALDFARPGVVRTPATRPGAPDAGARQEPQRTLDARWLDIPTAEAVERLARFLSVRLIFDETLTGSVSIEASEPLTESEAASMLHSLLLLRGFAAVLGPGGARKVLPITNAPGPWVTALAEQPDETPIVTLVRLKDIDAELVLRAIQPLVGDKALAQVHRPTNGILLAGAGTRLRRLADVMKSLDETGLRRLVLIPLRHTDAETMADVLLGAVNDRGGDLQVWPDARTNRLVVRGRPDAVERARTIVDRVDRPFEGEGRIQVLPVRHVDPDRLAEQLRQLASEELTSGVRGGRTLAGRDFAVSVHPPTHSLVVQADPQTIDLVRELVAELDQVPARVDVEVTVAEISHASSLDIALDALVPIVEPDDLDDLIVAVSSNPGGNLLAQSPDGGLLARVAQTPLVIPIVNPITGLPDTLLIPRATAVVSAEGVDVTSSVLLRPWLSMISGEQHEIFSGSNIPVPTAEVGDVGADLLQTRQTIERRDTGVLLRVQPTVPEDGPIILDLEVEVSRLSGSLSGGPTFNERTLTATVRLLPGLTAVVGWARLPASSRTEVGTPWLRKLPFIGAFFRRTVDIEQSTHLLIAVRAERDRPEAVVLTSWLARELAELESPLAKSIAPAP